MLPSVNAALDVARRLNAEELAWTDFARDSCHPHSCGHLLYCATLGHAIEEAVGRPEAPADAWPDPMTPAPLELADMSPIAPDTAFPGWTYRPLENRGGWACFDGLLESGIAGSEASFEFKGTTIGLFYQLGPESGDIEWAVDDGAYSTARVFDSSSEAFWRPQYRILAHGLTPGRHRLHVRVAPSRDPRSNGHWVKLASLLTA